MSRQSLMDAAHLGYLGNYHYRMKKAASTTSLEDAAGLPSTGKFQGRTTPLKGKGLPPDDQKESTYRYTKHFVPGRSFEHHEVVPLSGNTRPSTAPEQFRPAKRFIPDTSHMSHIEGTGVHVLYEDPLPRRSRGAGTLSPARRIETTTFHVMNVGTEDVAYNSGHYSASTPRPSTAQRKSGLKCTLATPTGRLSLIQAQEHVPLETARPPNPTSARMELTATRSSYFDAWEDYSFNRMKSQSTAVVLG